MLSLTSLFPRKTWGPASEITLNDLSPAEREWFHIFKWEHFASPAAMQQMMTQSFGARRAEELVIFFEKTAIPARPNEWRRRMH